MKPNWGIKILITYLIFVSGMLTLVFMTTLQNRDLVSENYYEEEIRYQHTINQANNTNSLSGNIEVVKLNDRIKIIFPIEFTKNMTSCKWKLYFAADKSKDIDGNFITTNGTGNISLNKDVHGTYLLKLNMTNEMKEYYFEKTIVF